MREHVRQARLDHFALRLFHRIPQPEQLDTTRVGVDDRVRGARVAVARLTDRSGIQRYFEPACRMNTVSLEADRTSPPASLVDSVNVTG